MDVHAAIIGVALSSMGARAVTSTSDIHAESAPMDSVKLEIAATAARMVVEEGLEYGPAKRRAVRQLGLNARSALPDNDAIEDAVREYIELFCADTQPAEL